MLYIDDGFQTVRVSPEDNRCYYSESHRPHVSIPAGLEQFRCHVVDDCTPELLDINLPGCDRSSRVRTPGRFIDSNADLFELVKEGGAWVVRLLE